MPDQHAPPQQPVRLQVRRTGLAVHLLNGGQGHLGIVRRGAVAGGQHGVGVFEVGKPDLHQPLQLPQLLHGLIAGTVPDHRDLQPQPRQGLGYRVTEMAGRHQVQVVDPAVRQAAKEVPQGGHVQLHPGRPSTDLPVLAVDAAQGAAGEEHRPAAPAAADAGFLPEVGRGPADQGRCGHAAGAGGAVPLRAAAPGTETAAAHCSSSRSMQRSPICGVWAIFIRPLWKPRRARCSIFFSVYLLSPASRGERS